MIWFTLEANCLRKFKNDIQIVVGPAFLELFIETCKILFVYIESVTLYQFSLFEKGVSEGDVPPQKLWKLCNFQT